MNDFNSLAWIYDFLARLVFGSKWNKVQTSFVPPIQTKTKILVLGGGTGAFLEYLEPYHHVTYLDLSEKMIEKAKQRKTVAQVDFANADFLNWETTKKFDAVVCPFFLDSFGQLEVEIIVEKIKNLLLDDGVLIVLDFQKGTWIQNVVMNVMHLFFKVFANLKSTRLLDLHALVLRASFEEQSVQNFYGNWIACRQYTLE
uniref:class I SAM-dependent methyltransferase n=1 Tax=Fulvivirga sp. TaxID=1931237 RepID=UPI00404AB701